MNQIRVPTLTERMQAIIADMLLIFGLMYLSTIVLEKLNIVSESPRMYLFLFFAIVYDPLFTSFGGTIGHRMVGLRVKQENNIEKNIMLPKALVRFGLKMFLGIISTIFIVINSNGKALHDTVVGSIVVYKKNPFVNPENIDKVEYISLKKKNDEEILDTPE